MTMTTCMVSTATMADSGQLTADKANRHIAYKSVTTFEDLEVYQRAYRLSLEFHKASLAFPKIEQFALADQLRRSSKSICANIAEGYGKQKLFPLEFKRFLAMALGSSDEMRVWINFCRDLNYISVESWTTWHAECRSISKMLQALIYKVS